MRSRVGVLFDVCSCGQLTADDPFLMLFQLRKHQLLLEDKLQQVWKRYDNIIGSLCTCIIHCSLPCLLTSVFDRQGEGGHHKEDWLGDREASSCP